MECFLPDRTIYLIPEVNKTYPLIIFYKYSVLQEGTGITHVAMQDPGQQNTHPTLIFRVSRAAHFHALQLPK